jgi:predicted phage gp36 major capsid-like protein
VCGFWDGGSFIPLDFSFHREKGTVGEDLIKAFKKAKTAVEKAKTEIKKKDDSLLKKTQLLDKATANYELNSIKTNKIKLDRAKSICEKVTQEHTSQAQDLVVRQIYKSGL